MIQPEQRPPAPTPALDTRLSDHSAEYIRYSRQIAMPEVGLAGQQRLRAATALIVGAGGLGSPIALYLAAAGVGRLVIVDGDRVELSNLGRQILHNTERIGLSKVQSARLSIAALNPGVHVEAVDGWLDEENIGFWVRASQVVVDGCDNFDTRYLVNKTCHQEGRILVTGAVLGFEGQLSVIRSGVYPQAPCYQCLYPVQPVLGDAPSCVTAGVFGALTGVVGSLQAAEALKILLGIGEPLADGVVLINLLDGIFQRIQGRKEPNCPVCSRQNTDNTQ